MNVDKEKLAAEVVKYQNGDGKAFEAIYNMTNQAAYFTALKVVKNEDDAQDVLQDSYVKVLDKLSTLDKPESFMSWFNMLVANTAKNYLAKNNPSLFKDEETEAFVLESIPEENEEYVPESSIEKEDLCRDVMSLIDSLSDEKRTAVMLYYYDEMTTKEIAESLGVNENTVKSRLVQAKKDLAKGVKELEKKNKKLFGVAPIPLVVWALKSAGIATGGAFASSGAAAATLTAVTAGTAAAGVAAGSAAAGTAAATTGIVGKIVAGVLAVAVIGGGAVAGTNAVRSRNSEKNAETTTAYVEEVKITEPASQVEQPTKKDDTIYFFVDKDKKKVDTDIEQKDMKYGVRGSFYTFTVKNDSGYEIDEKRPTVDRSGFHATYDELLPAANENKVKNASMINSTLDEINSLRSGMSGLTLDDTLTEQANVRAEEIAWSGKNFAARPDGSDYTTVFEQNGMTSGTRLEIRAFNYSSSAEAAKIWNKDDNKKLITNPLITKIGVGVAENPETGKYVFVVH
ncbi:MAG: sigma-70 family RNA polymerase sigma factor, partial [Clostridia bacterium]|nr:sigma-70 family RNA polymerase sigma factor [Clostridia bacterium]